MLGLSGTYTPQAIVNGENELVGSDKPKLHALYKKRFTKAPANMIRLTASAKGNNIDITYSVTDKQRQVLNIALVQKIGETNVRGGENSGRKLKHINIVQELKTIEAKDQGELYISIPSDLSATDCLVIAYTQDKDTLERNRSCGKSY